MISTKECQSFGVFGWCPSLSRGDQPEGKLDFGCHAEIHKKYRLDDSRLCMPTYLYIKFRKSQFTAAKHKQMKEKKTSTMKFIAIRDPIMGSAGRKSAP